MSACPAPDHYGAGENCNAVTIPFQPLPSVPPLADTGLDPLPLVILAAALIVAAVVLVIAARPRTRRTSTEKSPS